METNIFLKILVGFLVHLMEIPLTQTHLPEASRVPIRSWDHSQTAETLFISHTHCPTPYLLKIDQDVAFHVDRFLEQVSPSLTCTLSSSIITSRASFLGVMAENRDHL